MQDNIKIVRYKLIVAYDGTDYYGWQMQPDLPSVAQTLSDTFFSVFNRRPFLQGASRTDAGVHALGQVIICSTDLVVEPQKLMFAWNNLLPVSIMIRFVERIDDSFNLHGHVTQKTYWYHFFTEQPLPMFARYGYYYRYKIDFDKLRAVTKVFLGTHDFRAFSTGDERGDDTIRTINAIEIESVPEYMAYRIVVKGPKFLRYMVRRIVGACLHASSHNDVSIAYVKEILASKNPEHALPNAPAQGLLLYNIEYSSKG
jgi:tRNA pseudouridine38-40 synthase